MKKANKKLNNKKNISSRRQGFTLVEVIIAMGIFTIVMAGSAGVFASAFKSYKAAKNVNENVKNAQYAMNLMAKTFRTSSVKSPTGVDQSGTTIIVYDYSQGIGNPGLCIRFRFTAGDLDKATADTDYDGCRDTTSFLNTTTMTTGIVTGTFLSTDSAGIESGPGAGASTRVGKVTVVMDITSGTGSATSNAILQTTTSLRDYTISNVGLDPNNDPN